MSVQVQSSVRNHLLAALPPDLLEHLLPKLTSVILPLKQVLYVQDGAIEAVYFPTAGFISLVTNLSEGMQVEVGIVGCEGMLGLPLLARVPTSFVDALVQASGTALRMEATTFHRELEANPELSLLLRRYGETFQAQVTQTAACNGHHDLEQRLARWLLIAHDRLEGDELNLTQEFIATMLAVHRPSVTITARILQRAGLIRYRAGSITILDRPGLEAAACECYQAVARRTAAIFNI